MDEERHHEIYIDASSRVVTLVRTTKPFVTAADFQEEAMFFSEALRGLDRTSFGLVIDTRNGPGIRSEALEPAFAHFRKVVMVGFRGVAVVAASAAGKLHVKRNARQDRASELEVFDDLEEARSYVQAGGSERRTKVGASEHVRAAFSSRGARKA